MLQQTRCLVSILFYLPLFSYSFFLRTWPCFSHISLYLLSTKVSLCYDILCFIVYVVFLYILYRYNNTLTPGLGSVCFPHFVFSNGMCHRTSKIFNSGSWPLISCPVHYPWKLFLPWLGGSHFQLLYTSLGVLYKSWRQLICLWFIFSKFTFQSSLLWVYMDMFKIII